MLFQLSKKNRFSHAGFSILEMLVTAAIIGIITAVVLVRYTNFDSVVLLNNQAYEIALDVREAQAFSLSSRGEGSEFREEYGVYFTSEDVNRYRMFLDNGTVSPPIYDPGEEVTVPRIIDTRFEISQMCVDGCSQNVENVSISFMRPNFDALIRATGTVSGVFSDIRIDISPVIDPTKIRSVVINANGQIDVSTP